MWDSGACHGWAWTLFYCVTRAKERSRWLCPLGHGNVPLRLLICILFVISAANSCPTSPRGGARTHPSFDLPSAAYAAAHSLERSLRSSDEYSDPPGDLRDGDEHSPGSTGDGSSGCSRSKPPFSYAQLIVQAIASNPDHQLTLSGIYAYISRTYPYYRINDKGWQVGAWEFLLSSFVSLRTRLSCLLCRMAK